ncbi:MAG: ribonuclease Z [Flavobacteriales bacterium]|jgi:ribonuclease Z|uniref:ribonuclease Z n=1 Tax=Blattabacterium sp. (Mastotermes darwiniensis) TaxID=39768 RepID=UPI000231DF22|nr:ribonuclease Z [Blattabacterium sp. (Mastotermes darwiniensis)]AER40854.1 ribonuclease Z [Blattabacterium sp. (Mastotermes darwiniensis) str. MADAR]MDR1804701.1 ribonuclease Z [Flavobacteriales bacterium]
MEKSSLTILGCHSSIPTKKFYPTAQILEMKGNFFLIDCGEGTQVQLRKAKIKFNKIVHIFISHLHGDHFFGLIGLLSTFHLLGREQSVSIYAPKGLKEIIEVHFKWSYTRLKYCIDHIELSSKKLEKIMENETIEVYTIPLKHRIYANGFLFKEKPGDRKLNMEEIKKIPDIKIVDYKNLKIGKDFRTNEGRIIPNHRLTFDPPKILSYAFCSDTSYYFPIIEHIKYADLLYHESTFLKTEERRAIHTGHSTANQAACIAKMAKVKKLLLGHYSNRFPNIKDFEKEAKEIFYNVEASEPLKKYYLDKG